MLSPEPTYYISNLLANNRNIYNLFTYTRYSNPKVFLRPVNIGANIVNRNVKWNKQIRAKWMVLSRCYGSQRRLRLSTCSCEIYFLLTDTFNMKMVFRYTPVSTQVVHKANRVFQIRITKEGIFGSSNFIRLKFWTIFLSNDFLVFIIILPIGHHLSGKMVVMTMMHHDKCWVGDYFGTR